MYTPPIGAGGVSVMVKGPPLPGVLPAFMAAFNSASVGCAAQPFVAGRVRGRRTDSRWPNQWHIHGCHT